MNTVTGVHVHRVPLIPSHDRSPLRRALTYLSFAVSASTKWRILRSVDAWLVISSQATVALPAIFARRFFSRPYVLHIHDLWPDTVTESGFIKAGKLLNFVARCIQAFCNATYRRASTGSCHRAGYGVSRFAAGGYQARNCTVVPNWIDEATFRPRRAMRNFPPNFSLPGLLSCTRAALVICKGLRPRSRLCGYSKTFLNFDWFLSAAAWLNPASCHGCGPRHRAVPWAAACGADGVFDGGQ